MKEMVTSADCRHLSIRALALHAQRIGKVSAHPATWAKLVRERRWLRPRLRVYPAKGKMGVRADRPNAVWHVDCTILKLLDRSKAYVHAVIDNFSRRILAWTVDDRINPGSTCRILVAAAKNLAPGPRETNVFMDGGGENVNDEVDGLFDVKPLRRIPTQVDVSYSNSLIESWWRSLRHQWLHLNSLDILATVRRLVGCYVRQRNEVLPHAAFDGQMPDEINFAVQLMCPWGSHCTGKKPGRSICSAIARLRAPVACAPVRKGWRPEVLWRSQLRSQSPECSTT